MGSWPIICRHPVVQLRLEFGDAKSELLVVGTTSDVPAVHVEDDVQVGLRPLGRPVQLGDVPTP